MADDEKARLYRRIVEQTDEHLLLERMRLYGFWPDDQGLPAEPPEEAERRRQIEQEMAALRQRHSQVQDPEKALAQERIRRWQQSLQKRAQRKAEREREREQRRKADQARREATIVHAGWQVSGGLENDRADEERLRRGGLPVMHRSEDLARQMGVSIASLRWLTYHRRGAAVVHYHRYAIAKKSGQPRCISAPKPALAAAQRWVLDHILARVEPTEHAHGFVAGRSIVTTASPHAGREVVINLDLQDFFPSVTFRRVKGLFHAIGYSEHLATTLALLTTEPPRVKTELAGKVYHVALGDRALPQGACTSPAITNLVCRRFDRRLAGLARALGFHYTRYADDLTFSGDRAAATGRLLRSVRSILQDEGFREHPSKSRVMRRGRRQEVTGLTVNERPSVSRRELRELRAILHNAVRHGLESQNRAGRANFAEHLQGRVAFITMVNPDQGAKLQEKLNQALSR